jgi:hypothetical protein
VSWFERIGSGMVREKSTIAPSIPLHRDLRWRRTMAQGGKEARRPRMSRDCRGTELDMAAARLWKTLGPTPSQTERNHLGALVWTACRRGRCATREAISAQPKRADLCRSKAVRTVVPSPSRSDHYSSEVRVRST